ncbi:MAG: HD domain-containing protein [bacterium]|nr:HD domain-containing protein [bacterium]
MELLQKAIQYAEKIHKGTFRKSGEPYISHPLAVMKTLQKHGFSDKVLAAAVLHDVLEDTNDREKTEKELFQEFGDEVFFLVGAVSKDAKIRDKKERAHHYFEQQTTAMKRDPAVIFLKAADLLHNVSTLKYLSRERQDRWIHELKNYYLMNFLKNFHLIPDFQRDLYHELVAKLQKVIDRHEEG